MDLNSHDVDNNFNILTQMFPKANCEVVFKKCIEIGNDQVKFEQLIEDSLVNPAILESQSTVQNDDESQFNNLIIDKFNFDVEQFIYSLNTRDPLEYFDQMTRTSDHQKQSLEYLKHKYRFFAENHLQKILTEKKFNLQHAIFELNENSPLASEIPRLDEDIANVTPLCDNFIKEVKFAENFEVIQEYLILKSDLRLTAQISGETFECECCYADDVLDDEVMTCSEGHTFCNNCVKRFVEVRVGDAKTDFPCLQDCVGTVPLEFVKAVIGVKAFMKLSARIQELEVKAANLPGIEYCSACEYAVIPAENDPLFTCLKCSITTCRKCKKADHSPLKCGETIQEDRAKRVRLQTEENLTNQVVRKCTKCKSAYIKLDGCNVITCPCGTKLCYLCSAVLNQSDPYTHSCPTWGLA